MHIEAKISSHYRKRLKAQHLAQAGVEVAKSILVNMQTLDPKQEEAEHADSLGLFQQAKNASQGGRVQLDLPLGDGTVRIHLAPVEALIDVNSMSEEEWEFVLEQGGVDEEHWDELIDAFLDWVDDNDLHRLNGAESDDSFYKDKDYEVKNAPLDTIDELRLIKGFNKEVLYGRRAADKEDASRGILHMLTTWSDGRLNPNAADMDTLMALGMESWQAEAIIDYRENTGAEGYRSPKTDNAEGPVLFENIAEVLDIASLPPEFAGLLTLKPTAYWQVLSVGSVGEPLTIESAIAAKLRIKNEEVHIAFWQEGLLQ